MKIKFLHKGSRNQLICEKKDGSVEIADLGPSLPFHDIAHYVVEKRLNLRSGFYGNIFRGYTVKELSRKEIIQTLPAESLVAEIVTRALQSLASGACTAEQFPVLIKEEFDVHGISFALPLGREEITPMLFEFKELISRWSALKEGESLELNMDFN